MAILNPGGIIDGDDAADLTNRQKQYLHGKLTPGFRRCFMNGVRKALLLEDSGRRIPSKFSSIFIETTLNCNYRCQHCFHGEHRRNDIYMDDGVLDRVLGFATSHFPNVFFTGGEPVLDHRIFEAVGDYPSNIFFFFTNASLIDDQIVSVLLDRPNLFPHISIEGMIAKTHDRMRQPGSLVDVKRAARKLSEAGIPWFTSTTITALNWEEVVSEGYTGFLETLGTAYVKFSTYFPDIVERKEQFLIDNDMRAMISRRMESLRRKSSIPIRTTFGKPGRCRSVPYITVSGEIKLCPYSNYGLANISDFVTDEDLLEFLLARTKDWRVNNEGNEYFCPFVTDTEAQVGYLLGTGGRTIN